MTAEPIHRDTPVLIVGLLFAAMGLAALIDPPQILAPFGVDVVTAAGRNEVRAVYGGFGILVALALGIAVRSPVLRNGILVAIALALLGMAGGRLASFAIDQTVNGVPALFVAIEVSLAASLLAGRSRVPSS